MTFRTWSSRHPRACIENLYVDTLDLNRRILKGFKERELPPIVGLPEGTLRSAGFRRELGLALGVTTK